MQQLAGRHVQARSPDVKSREFIVDQRCRSVTVYRSSGLHCRQHGPYRLHVSCPAVEQDIENAVSSTPGRTHPNNKLIETLLTHDQAGLLVNLEQHEPESKQPDRSKQLLQQIRLSGSLPLLCELIQSEAQHFDHRVTSAALHRLSILCRAFFTQLQSAHLTNQETQQAAWVKYVDPTLKALGQLLLQHIDSCDSWSVSLAFWSYGHLQWSEDAVLAALSIRGMQLLNDFNTADCASALVGMSKLTGRRPRSQREFVEQLMQHTHELLSHVDEWSPRDIVSVVWALSQLGAAGPSRRPLLQGLVEMTQWRLHEFGVKEMVIIIYSLGRLRMRLPLQMVKLTNQIMKDLNLLKPQDAANLVYSCAKVQFKQPELLQKLPHVMIDQLSSFKPQEISNLLYGYGQLHYQHPALLEAVARTCPPRLPEFSTQDLCLIVWSYGASGYCPADHQLFEAICGVLLHRKERLVPLQVTMIAKGFSKAGYQPPAAFMQQISQVAQAKLLQFHPLEYSQLLWAYSTAGYRDVQLFEAVVCHCIQQLLTNSRSVTKTTVDTILFACRSIGFWPQALVDTAEISGLYVTAQKPAEAALQPLSTPTAAGAHASQPVASTAAAAPICSDSSCADVVAPLHASSAAGHVAAPAAGHGITAASFPAQDVADALLTSAAGHRPDPQLLLQQHMQQKSMSALDNLQRPALRQQQQTSLPRAEGHQQQHDGTAQPEQQQQQHSPHLGELKRRVLPSHVLRPPSMRPHPQGRTTAPHGQPVQQIVHSNSGAVNGRGLTS